ncbi:MAG: 3'(2'),5'-bisphosphate nucleotidase [Kordiimonas sp.]|nr:3'(2'),5'-bisphosphate nucleotidase [Kordiimonas sp.]
MSDLNTADYAQLAQQIRHIALKAGAKIMEIYRQDITVAHKADNSPVTIADEAGEKIIIDGLEKLSVQYPIIAEESVNAGHIPEVGTKFWLVDPLDGTKEFINKNGEFTVNIALIENGSPSIGVVYAPAMGNIYLATSPATATVETLTPAGDWTDPAPLIVRPAPTDGLTAVASRSHRDAQTDAYLEKFNIKELRSAGSSLKFCLVAAGEADLYPRFGPTMEWDTGAGHAVLKAAGGTVMTPEGQVFTYGKADYRNGFFIAAGRDIL